MMAKRKTGKTGALATILLLVVPMIFVSASTQKSRGGDFRGFLVAGERFIHGDFLYEGSSVGTNVTWPPFFALFIVPFAALARINLPFAQVMWYLLNTLLFFIAVGLLRGVYRNKPFGWFIESKGDTFWTPAVFIPVVLVLGPFVDNVLSLQISPLLLFLLAMGISNLHEKRPVRAGIWLGLAGAIKAFPVLIILYLIYRKEVRAMLSMALSGLMFTAMPILRYGFHDFIGNFRAWIDLSLAGGYPYGGLNQSFYALIARFVSGDAFNLLTTRLPSPGPHDPAGIASAWIYRLSLLALIGALLWFIRRNKFRSLGVETAFFITLMTVFSPIAWRHYFVLMVPAWIILTAFWLEKKDKILGWMTVSSGVLITGGYIIGTLSRPVRSVLLNVTSHFTLGALVILAGLLYCVHKKYGNQNTESPV